MISFQGGQRVRGKETFHRFVPSTFTFYFMHVFIA